MKLLQLILVGVLVCVNIEASFVHGHPNIIYNGDKNVNLKQQKKYNDHLNVNDTIKNTGEIKSVSSQTDGVVNRWDGYMNADWNEPYNWSLWHVPNETENVTIQVCSNGNYPTISNDMTLQSLKIESGAKLTIDTCELVITNDFIKEGKLYFVGRDAHFPSIWNNDGVAINGFTENHYKPCKFYHLTPQQATFCDYLFQSNSNDCRVYRYSQNTETWNEISMYDYLQTYQPINIIFRTAHTNTSALNSSTSKLYSMQEGWFHVGNPYQNYLDIAGLKDDPSGFTGLEYTNRKVYQYKDVGSEEKVVIIDIDNPELNDPACDGKIAPKRAFWMYALENGSYQINSELKCPKHTTTLKSTEKKDLSHIIKLTCGVGEKYDYAAIKLIPEELATVSNIDALKFEVDYKSIPSLAILKNKKELSIAQILMDNEEIEIPITVNIPDCLLNKKVELNFLNATQFNSGYNLYLKRGQKTVEDLINQPMYSFKPSETTMNFTLNLKPVSTMVKSITEENNIITYCENKVITIINDDQMPISEYEIFNIHGVKIKDGTLDRQVQVPVEKQGAYVIVIYNSTFSCVKKVIAL